MNAPTCPYCNQPAKLVDSSVIYRGTSYGWAWMCPECPSVYVGCHKGTTIPLGRLANAQLREAKVKAHAVFDPLWRSRRMTRSDAYAWLAEALGIPKSQCHIGLFDLATCRRVIALEIPNRRKATKLRRSQ